ncbi:uncharacterized protein TNCT_412291 [Trichonephila clavata]|uniref:HTH cro/C1-type domain-containing protein n=1 Tax=Trichonephila clavata TaxID=2740835 RepID=A0A8X6HHZ7_TRICU|nr:uncharacterized protein TNCT_412291 [Trichonephila clavata]
MLAKFLSQTSGQLKEHCALLSSEEKQNLYSKVLNEVKSTPRDSREGIDQLKKLSKVAVAIEETIDLEKFNDDHPLREISIAYVSEGATNYLFSLSDSSELYDLEENREKAIYQAIKSNDRELVKHLLMVLTSELEFFKELEVLLSEAYEELKENLSQDMKNYLEKNISLKRFVCNNVNILVAEPVDVQAMINLFIVQSGVNYKIDELLLIKIAEGLEEGELLSQVNQMIETLKKHERFMELKYKVRRLKSELASGKSKYSAEAMKSSIEEREREMREIGDKSDQVILQYEKGTRRISIKKLYELAEALSTTARDLACGQEVSKRYEEEEILNLVRRHKEIKDQELRETFYLLTRFIRISEERSGKAVKIEVARGLVKAGVSAHVISRTTNLSISEYEEKKISIPYKVGQRIKEWRLRREYTQEDLANKVGITNQRIYEYEQGRAAVSLETLDEIAKVLSISIIDLIPESTEDENSEVGLSNLIEEYKKIESQELRDVLIKSLFEGIRVCNEKVREAKKVEVARNLIKEGISVDIISQTTGHKF